MYQHGNHAYSASLCQQTPKTDTMSIWPGVLHVCKLAGGHLLQWQFVQSH